jgi:hypothetical protein
MPIFEQFKEGFNQGPMFDFKNSFTKNFVKNGDIDSKYCYFGAEKDHNNGFPRRRQIFAKK